MAAKEMWDYLSPTYLTRQITLSTPLPHRVLTESGGKKHASNYTDNASCEVVALSTSFSFSVTLQWENLSAADAGTIMEFYCSTDYANGRKNLFKWVHPSDGHTYVARFDCDLQRTIQSPELHSLTAVRLKIVGGAPTYRLVVASGTNAVTAEALVFKLRANCIAGTAAQNVNSPKLTLT